MKKSFNVVICKENGVYWGFCPALHGCHTDGDTIEEVKENIKEAIELCLEDYEDYNEIIEEPVTFETVTLEIA